MAPITISVVKQGAGIGGIGEVAIANTTHGLDIGHGIHYHRLIHIETSLLSLGGANKVNGGALFKAGEVAAQQDFVAFAAIEINQLIGATEHVGTSEVEPIGASATLITSEPMPPLRSSSPLPPWS